jgi:putative ABC transport system substrate-binding protein
MKGESPERIPFQPLTKQTLTINLPAAKTCGVTVPEAVLARADQVVR